MDSIIGYVEETVGSAIGNTELEDNAALRQYKADAEYKAAQKTSYNKYIKQIVIDEDAFGSTQDNEQMQPEGKAFKTSKNVKDMNS